MWQGQMFQPEVSQWKQAWHKQADAVGGSTRERSIRVVHKVVTRSTIAFGDRVLRI